jgi:molecular chaperone GrpE
MPRFDWKSLDFLTWNTDIGREFPIHTEQVRMMAGKAEHHEQDNISSQTPEAGVAAGEAQEDAQIDPSLAAAEEAARHGFSNPLEFLNAELERSEAEKAELKDRLIRAAAEMENLRKRTARDVADAREYSISSFAREMLAVSDNLRRALEAIPHEARDAGDAGFKALIDGVELTERAMLQALERAGVRKVSPKGERFDANYHQAMFEIPNPEVPHNTVLEVVQDGFVIGERMLRPAMVGVSRGGPKVARPAAENAVADEGGQQD